jgi:CheY-like chemotaxis protein
LPEPDTVLLMPEPRILVVDDDGAIRRLLTMMLEDEGYQVVAAETGEQALAAIERDAPALILLDVLLPGIDGWEVLRRLRPDSSGLPPIILLTAGTVPPDRQSEFSGFEIVTKPFDADDLMERIGRHLRARA